MADKHVVARRVINTMTLDFTSASGGVSTAFTAQTYVVRLCANAPFHFKIYDTSASSTVSSASAPMLGAGEVDYIGVQPGQKISAIKTGGGSLTSADGRLTIAEMS